MDKELASEVEQQDCAKKAKRVTKKTNCLELTLVDEEGDLFHLPSDTTVLGATLHNVDLWVGDEHPLSPTRDFGR